jgi:hypothetical protein
VIGPEDRAGYIGGLEKLQLGQGEDVYWTFMAGRLEASIDLQLTMLGGG